MKKSDPYSVRPSYLRKTILAARAKALGATMTNVLSDFIETLATDGASTEPRVTPLRKAKTRSKR